MFLNCLIHAILYFTTYQQYCNAHFSKFIWKGFFYKICKNICFQIFFFLFFILSIFGQRPRQGTKSCRMGSNSVCPYVRTSVRASVPPLADPQTLLAGPQTPPAGPQTLPASPQTPPAGPQTLPAGPQTPSAGLQTPPAGLQTPSAGPQTPQLPLRV